MEYSLWRSDDSDHQYFPLLFCWSGIYVLRIVDWYRRRSADRIDALCRFAACKENEEYPKHCSLYLNYN